MKFKQLGLILIFAGLLWSCAEKNVEPASEAETNNWILGQMKYWYYWNDKITATPDFSQKPDAFFNSLLYKYDATARPDGDRFSWIEESADDLKASLSGETKSTGMHYKLVLYPAGGSNVAGVVFYSLPGSPAAAAGFRRGDIFTSVNGQKLTAVNYSQLLAAEGEITFTLGAIDEQGEIVQGIATRKVTPVTLQEDPVFFDTTFQYGASKIGYVVYHQFIPGPNGGDATLYDKKLEAIFAKYKASNVRSLIVDLRYNPGGYVSSATTFASLIGKVTANDIFYVKEYNSKVTPDLEKKYGKAFFSENFSAKSQNIGSQLEKLTFLVSSRSASASELMINGLKPFMPVMLVGGKTVGKNVGSITISDDKKKVKWGLQPIVTKSFNSLKQSDYSAGFTPDFPVTEGNKLFQYGDPRDPLLGEALFQIIGTRVARVSAESQRTVGQESREIMSTIERKAGGSNMFFDW
jgi:carboxyl-terminal processing protease